MPELGEHLDQGARDLQPPLRGLVGVGDGADVQGHRTITGLGQGLPQTLRRVDLADDVGLEIEPRREPQIAVGGAGVAVDAAMLTATVRVDRQIEPDIGRVVAAEDGTNLLLDQHRGRRRGLLLPEVIILEAAPAIVDLLAIQIVESGLDAPDRSPALLSHGGSHRR
jgi:hypothetical protein